MKKRVLSLFMAFVLCLTLLPTAALAEETSGENETPAANALEGSGTVYDRIDKDGSIVPDGELTNYCSYGGSEGNETWNTAAIYLVEEDATIKGNLTVSHSEGTVCLVLGAGATLTIKGALILGNNEFYIYGQTSSGDTGQIVIEDTDHSEAPIRSSGGSVLHIRGGKLTAKSTSNYITDGVELSIENPTTEWTPADSYKDVCKAMKGTIDDEPAALADWSGNKSVQGKTLVIKYCGHSNATYERSGDTQHITRCDDCGFVGTAVACGKNGTIGHVSDGENGHYSVCACGNKYGSVQPHSVLADGTLPTLPTEDGKHHATRCNDCGYTSGTPEEHTYDEKSGECTVCGFEPVAFSGDAEDPDALYDSLQTAFETIEDGGTITLTADVIPDENITFGEYYDFKTGELVKSDKAVKLVMGGNTLCSMTTSNPALTVSGGSLTIADAATITAQDESGAAAIKVEDGSLTFKGAVDATGGSGSSSAAPAIEVTGGTVTFEGNVTAKGGLQGSAGNLLTRFPAIKATGGELDFYGTKESQVELDLLGGLTLTGSAKLTRLLTKGTFYRMPAGSTGSFSGFTVSVTGSTYKLAYRLLEDGYAFAVSGTENTQNITYAGRAGTEGNDVTIISHEHFYDPEKDYTCVCNESCTHPEYVNGECKVCHKPCEHGTDDPHTDGSTYCGTCGQRVFARIKTGEYTHQFFTDLVTAMDAATNGQTIELIDNMDNSNKYAILTGNSKAVTLDLRGHTITGGLIFVGIDRNRNDYTSSTLKIIGSGSFITSGNLSVGYKATLDLSGWGNSENDKISTVSIDENGTTGDDGKLIVSENTKGTIESLQFSSKNFPTIKNTKLTGGRYDKIYIAQTSHTGGANWSVPFSDLLATGYAFRYTNGSGYVAYDTKAEYASSGLHAIEKVKVVRCPHADAENGTCLYCNHDGIRAKVGETPYDNVSTAVTYWLENGGTLKLFADISGDSLDLSNDSANGKPLIIDLNGHSFYEDCTAITLGGKNSLTIKDTKGTGVFGPVEAASGWLTLERGTLKKLTVSDNSTATISMNGGILQELTILDTSTAMISLMGGQVNCISSTLPVYKLLPNGKALMKNGDPVDPTEILYSAVEAAYTVKDPDNTAQPEGRQATISYGQNTLPFDLALKTEDGDVKLVKFTWYRVVNADGAVTELASTGNIAPSNGIYTYDTTATGTTALNSLAPGEYKAICVISGLNSDGVCLWKTTLGNRDLIVEKANLSNAEIQFVGGNSAVFNPFDNHETTAPTFTVTCNGKTLENGTDYTVSGNTATAVGTYTLTITAATDSKYYTGSKDVQWESCKQKSIAETKKVPQNLRDRKRA